MADAYMKPLSPDNREVIQWIGNALRTGKADFPVKGKK